MVRAAPKVRRAQNGRVVTGGFVSSECVGVGWSRLLQPQNLLHFVHGEFPASSLSQRFPPAAICYVPSCPQIKKPIRTQHCFSCDACVAKQDHHSIWINGCIGASISGRVVANGQRDLTGLLSSRCQEPSLLRPLPALAHADGKLDVLLLPHVWVAWRSCPPRESGLTGRSFRRLLVVSDWANHCVLHYADQGLWAAASALVDCSPWLLCIFFLAFYHTCWSASVLLVQLYQVTFKADMMQQLLCFPFISVSTEVEQKTWRRWQKSHIYLCIIGLRGPPAGADRLPGTDLSRADHPDVPAEETQTVRLPQTESVQVSSRRTLFSSFSAGSWPVSPCPQSGCGPESGFLLPAALLWPLQTSHHRLDAAVPARPRTSDVRSRRHGLTTQGQGSNPKMILDQKSRVYLFMFSVTFGSFWS